MGMFDQLYCDWPLPAVAHMQGFLFQTKSFDPEEGGNMDFYRIAEDGQLYVRYRHDAERREVPSEFTGMIEFYAFEDEVNETGGLAYFEAVFLDGQLQRLQHTRTET